jgi:hypothetical protein
MPIFKFSQIKSKYQINGATLKSIKYSFCAIAMGLFAACGTPTKTAEQQEYEYYIKAADALKKGDCQQASSIVNALYIYTTNNRLKQLFKENTNAESCIIDLYTNEVKTSNGINRINGIRFNVDKLYSSQAITGDTIVRFNKFFEESVKEKIKNGSMNVSFDDAIKDYAFLADTEIQDIIAINTIRNFKNQNTYSKSGLQQLADYVEKSQPNSSIRIKMKEALPHMNLKLNELAVFEKIDQKFVSERRLASTMKAFVEYKSIDRLTADDISEIIKKSIKGVEWTSISSTSSNVISIEKIRHSEVVGQERTQTISYADYQVDRMAAVLFMPRNASYLFDLVSSDVSIDYGYVISYQKNGQKISEEVVRGVDSHQNKRCQHKRIQNVFGGNQAADFDANDDMRGKCSGYSKSVESMRTEIYNKIAHKVLEIEDIRKVHAMN